MMRRKFLAIWSVFFFSWIFFSPVYAIQVAVDEKGWQKEADLIITGEVIDFKRSEIIKNFLPSHDGRKCYATIRIQSVVKGKSESPEVVLEFMRFEGGPEGEIHKNTYSIGSKGTAYLVKLPNGHYKEIRGWTYEWNVSKPKIPLSAHSG